MRGTRTEEVGEGEDRVHQSVPIIKREDRSQAFGLGSEELEMVRIGDTEKLEVKKRREKE